MSRAVRNTWMALVTMGCLTLPAQAGVQISAGAGFGPACGPAGFAPAGFAGGFPGFGFSYQNPTFGVNFYNYQGSPLLGGWGPGFYGGGLGFGAGGSGLYPGYFGGIGYGAPFGGPYVVQLPPRVIRVPVLGYPRRRSSSPSESGFYLDRPGGRTEAPRPAPEKSVPARPEGAPRPERPAEGAGVFDPVLLGLRVTPADKDSFVVRWTGTAQDLTLIEVRALDGQGAVLGSRVLREAPFRGLLRTPEGTRSVTVTLEYSTGASAGVKLPFDRFRALAKD